MIRDERGAKSSANIFVQATEGMRYAAKHPGIRPVLILVIALAIGIKPTLELLAGVTDTVYNLGPTGLGNLMAASAVGATIAAIWLAQRGTVVGMTRIVIGALVLGIVSLFAFTATPIICLWSGLRRFYWGGHCGRWYWDTNSDAKCRRWRDARAGDEPLRYGLSWRTSAWRFCDGVGGRVYRVSVGAGLWRDNRCRSFGSGFFASEK